MKKAKVISWAMTIALLVTNCFAYEVWIGTHLMRSSDATNLSTWSLTASQVDGFNVNQAPHDTDPASNDVENRIATMPIGVAGRRFVRLEISR